MRQIAEILRELPQTTLRQSYPAAPLTVVMIASADAQPADICAQVVCIDLKTAGVILTPQHWHYPDAEVTQLWAPPDHVGWKVLDLLESAGLGRIAFWDRKSARAQG